MKKQNRDKPEEERHQHAKYELETLSELDTASCKEDYETAARDIYDTTGEAETASTIMEFGIVPAARAIGHFIGLQMAINQLNNKTTP